MAADGFRKKGNKAWQDQAGGAPAAKQTKGPAWKQGDAPKPGTGSRRIKIIALLALIGAVIGGAIFIILLLQDKPKPVFVIVGANPKNDADKLNVPIDPFGWQSALEFLKRTKTNDSRELGSPSKVPSTPTELKDWVKGFPSGYWRAPLVIYIGLHSGTDSTGPVLFNGGTGPDGKASRVAVKDIITAIKENTADSLLKVLILDPGRLPPDPMYGQLHDDFVFRLKKDLNQAIKDCPNLVVICGTDVDQRGYESEEMQSTAMAQFVIRGLQGEAGTPSNDIITALQLFQYIHDQTKDWSEKNRSKPQTPILLPEGQDGIDRAQEMKVTSRTSNTQSTAPAPKKFADPDVIEDLDKLWDEHDKLASAAYSPSSYTPRAWRRYRELLLRYEWAARAGETNTCGALKATLAGLRNTINSGAVDTKPFESSGNSLAFWAMVHNGGETPKAPDGPIIPAEPAAQIGYSSKLLDTLIAAGPGGFPARLPPAAEKLNKAPTPGRRSAETHLPVMVNHFYQVELKTASPLLPAEWVKAFAVKRLAERSAVGLSAAGKPLVDEKITDTMGTSTNPYAERIWPVIHTGVVAADKDRREGEDRLFATAEKETQTAAGKTKAAGESYEKLADSARVYRSALILRDRVLADLPFLTRWISTSGPTGLDSVKKLLTLWNDVHKLNREIDEFATQPNPTSADKALLDLTRLIAEQFDELSRAFKAECTKASTTGSFQDAWTNIQVLLTCPLIDKKTRMTLLTESWKKSYDLETGAKHITTSTPNEAQIQQQLRTAAALRGRMARVSLGTELLDAQATGDSLQKSDAIESLVVKLETLPATEAAKWGDLASEVGTALGGHYQKLGQELPKGTKDLNPQAERFSRMAVAIDSDTTLEPAAVNHRLRWRDLLIGLAERTVLDHWYDEGKNPYFADAADAYLKDADKAVTGLPAGAALPRSKAIELALSAPRLRDTTQPTIDWTSERERVLKLWIDAPDNFPVDGLATAFRGLDGESVLQAGTDSPPLTDRTIQPLGPKSHVMVNSSIKTVDDKSELSVTNCATTASVYFRGQLPRQTLPIRVNRRPDLVLLDPLPKEDEKKVSIAIEAAEKLKLGTVVVLIDTSWSMKEDLNGDAIGNENKKDDWRKGYSKYEIAFKSLTKVLGRLPEGTSVRIRMFKGKGDATSRRVYSSDDANEKWRPGTTDERLKNLMQRLEDMDPWGFTPLVDSIKEAVLNDFSPKDPPGTKTLIVLTDGIEQSIPGRPTKAAMIAAHEDLSRLFKRDEFLSVSMQVVQLALGNDVELANELFKNPDLLNDAGCDVWPVTSKDADKGEKELTEALLATIWPKLRIFKRDEPRSTVNGYPFKGWPSVPKTNDRKNLNWSPLFESSSPESYHIRPQPPRDNKLLELLTSPGDRLIIRFDPDREGGTGLKVHRTLYADYLKAEGRLTADRERDQKWTASFVENWTDTSQSQARYKARVAIERKERDIIQQTRPDVLWWDVSPKDAGPVEPRTVRITKLHARPAPMWEIDASNWPQATDKVSDFQGAHVRVWVPNEVSAEKYLPDNPPVLKFNVQPPHSTDDKLHVRYGFNESYAFGGATAMPCFVIRVTHPLNQPVHAKLTGITGINAEHRYYKRETESKTRQFAEYTAIFGPITQTQIEDGSIKVQFLAVDVNPPRDHVMEFAPTRSQNRSSQDDWRPPLSK